jgi:hypothetical protein
LLEFPIGTSKQSQIISFDPGKTNRISIPPSATNAYLKGGDFKQVQFALPAQSSATNFVDINLEKRTWSGLQRALGVKGVKNFEANVQVKENKP